MHCKWYCWLSHRLGQEGSAGKALSSSSWTCSAGRCLFCALRTAKTIIRYQPLWFRRWGKHSNKLLSRKTTGGGVLTATEWKQLNTCWWGFAQFFWNDFLPTEVDQATASALSHVLLQWPVELPSLTIDLQSWRVCQDIAPAHLPGCHRPGLSSEANSWVGDRHGIGWGRYRWKI